MLLKIISTIILLNISMLKCEEDCIKNADKVGNLSVKFGNTTEIRFHLNDHSTELLQLQFDALRLDQAAQFAELNAKLDKIILDRSEATQTAQTASSCAVATALSRRTGVYQILLPDYSAQPFVVSCDEDTQGGGWTIILRRADGSTNFYRYWNDYKSGFGNVNSEYFIGLDKLHAMTKGLDQELLIIMEDDKGQTRFAKYDRFAIGSEKNLYVLHSLGQFSGDAGDSLSGHLNNNFSTHDRDNDQYEGNCAEAYTGAWWYTKCHSSNLMGMYNDNTYGKGINWLTFTGHNASLKHVQMMIRYRR